MQEADAISAINNGSTAQDSAQAGGIGQTTSDAFGLEFEDLLGIVLTQLTFQDPLKPMDNFEFVSQLAQFSQIQQGEDSNENLEALISAEASGQATALLGRTVDIPAGNGFTTGTVTSVSFLDGAPKMTIKTEDDQTISDISLSGISRVAIKDDTQKG